MADVTWSTLAHTGVEGGDLFLLGYLCISLSAKLRKAFPLAGAIAPNETQVGALVAKAVKDDVVRGNAITRSNWRRSIHGSRGSPQLGNTALSRFVMSPKSAALYNRSVYPASRIS